MATRTSSISRRTAQKFRQFAISTAGSVKVKLLLCCCCMFFTLIVLSSLVLSVMGWDHQTVPPDRLTGPREKFTQRGNSLVFSSFVILDMISLNFFYSIGLLFTFLSSGSLLIEVFIERKGYALLINTWKRNYLLKQSISHYTSCPRLDAIHIVWSEPDPLSDSLVKYLKHVVQSKAIDGREVELKFDINKEDSLNNRFKEITDLKTDAIFSVDDDIIFPCSSVEFAFTVWQSAPDTMVGFVPRMHWADQSKSRRDYYIYGGWWSVWWTGTYSMVLSKAAFFHKKYLHLYTTEMPASIREYVTKNRNCEDIAMSFLVANSSSAPPIWVKGKIYEIGSTGISSLGGHTERRTHCVSRFVAEYRGMPLVSTSMKAVDSRDIWFW